MSPTPSIPTSPGMDKDPPVTKDAEAPLSCSPSLNPAADSKTMPPPSPGSNVQPTIFTTAPSFHPTHSRSTYEQHLEPQAEEPKAVERPPFTPFFTLINDASTQSTVHPRKIHYIFSDDDSSELLTTSLLKSLGSQNSRSSTSSPARSRESLGRSEEKPRSSATSSSSSATFRKQAQAPNPKKSDKSYKEKEGEREERVIIVDINESGDGITGICSLSPSWQVLSAQLDSAPTFDTSPDPAEPMNPNDVDKGLMLRIEGININASDEPNEGLGITKKGASASASGSRVMTEEEMQALLEVFDRKMAMLRRIVSAGEEYSMEGTGNKEDEIHAGA